MSLINDALRKAQSERDRPIRMSQGLGDLPAPGSPQPPPLRKQTLSAGIVLGAALTALVAAVVLWFTNAAAPVPEPAPAPSQAAAAAAPAQTLAEPTATEEHGEVSAPETAAATAPADVAVVIPATAAPAPLGATAATESAVAPLSPAATAEPADPGKPEAATDNEPRIAFMTDEQIERKAFVDALRISMVRGSGASGRAMIGGRLHRQGDVVEPKLGLLLERIEPHSLVFVDALGNKYAKPF